MDTEQQIEALVQFSNSCHDAIRGACMHSDPYLVGKTEPLLLQNFEDVMTQLRNLRAMADRRITLLRKKE